MEPTTFFKNYLRKFIDITDEEFERILEPVITVRRFDKKELITKAGEMESRFNFIVKGLVRKYYKKNHHEINTQISYEGHLILSQESFYSRQPSEYFIETIEPTTVVTITYDD